MTTRARLHGSGSPAGPGRARRESGVPAAGLGRLGATIFLCAAILIPLGLTTSAAFAATPTGAQVVSATEQLTAIACSSATICQAVGPGQNTGTGMLTTITSGVPNAAQVVPGTSILQGLACSGGSTCVTVGYNNSGQGVVVPIAGGTPGAAQTIDGMPLYAVACATSTTCLGVGQYIPGGQPAQGVVVPIINGARGIPYVVAGTELLRGVACPTATTCVAVGVTASAQGVVVSITDGTPGSAHAVTGATSLDGVACNGATTCVAVGCPAATSCDTAAFGEPSDHAVVVPIAGGTPGAVQLVSGTDGLLAVACPTATTCVAVGNNNQRYGVVIPVTSGTPGAARVLGTSILHGVACPSATTCEAVGANFSSQGVVIAIPVADPSLKGYTALTPVRICDTRAVAPTVAANPCQGAGGVGVKLAQTPITVKVAGTHGVPDTATAAVLNVTATNTTAASYLTVWPTGVARPTASNLNWRANQTVPNLVEVSLGADGSVNLYVNAGSADVIVDLEGYVDAVAPGLYHPLTPARICDSRAAGPGVAANQCQGSGGAAKPLTVGKTVITAAMAGVPTGATAVILNVTVTNTSAAGFLTVWPEGAGQPVASNLNWSANQTVPNRVIVPLGTGRKIDLFNSTGTTDVVVDVNGYYSAAGGSGYRPSTPIRVCDTRPAGPGVAANSCNDLAHGGGALGPGQELTLTLPAGTTGSVFNVTVVGTTATSYLTVFPDPTPGTFAAPPLISDLNWTAGQIVANLTVVSSGAAQTVAFYNNTGKTDVVVDLQGDYSTAPTATVLVSGSSASGLSASGLSAVRASPSATRRSRRGWVV
ncbi:MAG: hypothetical protein QOF81_1650 [Acidimicrobiaceae bacterium]|nr:hypothetical protein [Acidimicrobiaceae bacterium]